MPRTPSDYEKPSHAGNIGRTNAPHDLNKTSIPKKTGPVSNKAPWPKSG